MAFTFQLEEPGTTKLGRETGRADPWADTFAQVAYGSGLHLTYRVDSTGLLRVTPASREDCATIVKVITERPHRVPFRWRILNPSTAIAKEGGAATVELGARLRQTLITFNLPFYIDKRLNSELVEKAGQSGIDDVTCVYGLRKRDNIKSHKVQMLPSGPSIAAWKDFITRMHKQGLEVHVGYSFGSLGKNISQYERNYATWFDAADDGVLEDHVNDIRDYLQKNDLKFDGLSFDIESNAIGHSKSQDHQNKLRTLFRKSAKILGKEGMTISYFNGPFVSKSDTVTGSIDIQRFDIPVGQANLLARPMCYDGVNARDYSVVANSIDYALRKTTDNNGAGLHPSQLQMAIWTSVVTKSREIVQDPAYPNDKKKTITKSKPNPRGASMEKYCKELLRPNRIGLCVYTLPKTKSGITTMLDACKQYDEWLNGPAPTYDRSNEPLQSARNDPTRP